MTTVHTRAKRRAVGTTREHLEQELVSNLYYQRGTTTQSASSYDAYYTLALTVRDRLVDRYARTTAAHYAANPRFLYYLSAEYMLGRQLTQNMLSTDTEEPLAAIVSELGLSLDELARYDVEPGLGNGGLGRLAACLLDALATSDIPAVGYGIRYEFGIFKQAFTDGGGQLERPDDWAFYGNPWEFAAPDDRQLVGFYGTTEPVEDDPTGLRRRWIPGEVVRGEPSHMLVPGYGTQTVNIIRLWQARASRQSFNLERFSAGEYVEAVEDIVRSENISKVLYPDDSTEPGRELRLKQQYFLVSCSLRDIIRRYHLRNSRWDGLADKVVIQLNDTHPVMAVAELMRLLVDEHGVAWEQAWSITRRTFAYTCHTLMPEALETWPTDLVQRLLPRHMEIIYAINHFFLDEVRHRYPGDTEKVRRLSIVQEEPVRSVRMAHLATVGSFAVNGVAELHSRLLADTTLTDFAQLWPDRFHNVTNGVSPRRFLRLANPRLSALITAELGDDRWLTDLERLEGLTAVTEHPALLDRWRSVKRRNKAALAVYAAQATGVVLDPDAMCDVMIKRFHAYKRQLLKILHVVTLFNRIHADPDADRVPRSFVVAGKAAPGYHAMKRLMRLVNAVAATVNADPVVSRHLRVVFLPDYNVTRAELIVPAADLSEQISLAGTEASGTGNMKLALNGALTIGTLDGANIEIRDRVGADNFFLFGLDAGEAAAVRAEGCSPRRHYENDEELRAAVDAIAGGVFSHGDRAEFADIVHVMLTYDEYLALADYRSYVDCQDAVDAAWCDTERWTRMSVVNTARCGFFSADRTVRDYRERIWRVDPVPVSPQD
ncbi:glycogen/starch/alpha-glucan phosphorylase [Dactylosporangium aurantiacum]|uniref:Alpha-1,4 glucan phosphorylase n=1 Tax=Dactylosporangium aurantiacum TaxID=35754 RepID=A0A9Q9MG52_9ACTN|nr:glycogen/starch/alpha-glucan phosphorylase [Dactylosporangium aurantiacum]MDG6105902.1 glycogen/starch/alpha-glucan phosphorylase [Dactylosporangium aurantiacum]UWZ57923.1 glycogen/starch/alpha-glucan phosphorylase [Dactylosporangium aurantiacum]